MSKRERLAMPPEAMRAVEMLKALIRVVAVVADISDVDRAWVRF